MVFYTTVLVVRPRTRKHTTQMLKEFGVQILNGGGVIRKFSNEGIIKPYKRFRDSSNQFHNYARYLVLEVDLSEEENVKLSKTLRDHPDVLKIQNFATEKPPGVSKMPHFFPLDTFSRREEEIHWPPQVSNDVYEQLDANWKEFSRTRWSNFLRS